MIARPASLVAAVALLGATRPARAEEGGEPVRIAYSAPAGCPDERAFADRLRERAAHVWITSRDEPVRTLVVTVASRAHGASATFVVVAPDGTRTDERTYESTTCSDVVNVVALAAALTIDEEESSTVEPPPPPTPLPRAEPGVVVAPQERVAAPPPRRWAFAAGILGAAESGVAPAVVGALRISVEARAPWRGHPAVRAAFTRTASATAVVEDAAASFTWTSALFDVCPYAFEAGIASFSPCARLELGALVGQGERVEPAQTETRFWLAAGALGRLRLAPWRPIFFEIEAGMRAPMLRDSFNVRADLLMFRPPALGWNAGAGVGVLFP